MFLQGAALDHVLTPKLRFRASTWTEEFGVADLNVSRFDARHQDPVTLHKLHKCVSDGITSPPDPDGLHHAGVSQLTDTQLPVK